MLIIGQDSRPRESDLADEGNLFKGVRTAKRSNGKPGASLGPKPASDIPPVRSLDRSVHYRFTNAADTKLGTCSGSSRAAFFRRL